MSLAIISKSWRNPSICVVKATLSLPCHAARMLPTSL